MSNRKRQASPPSTPQALLDELREQHAAIIAQQHRADMDLLAVRVLRFRLQRKQTQETLAERANLSIGTVRKIEQRRADDTTVGTVRALAYALDIDPDALFRRK